MLKAVGDKFPVLHPTARLAETASVVGDVTLGPCASVWYGAVLRGDTNSITVGENSNLQDNVVVHVGDAFPTVIGKNVTVGHGAIVHGCTVGDGALIGMGAVLLNGCVIGAGSTVAAGAVVTQGAVIPPGSMVMGVPGRVVRPLHPEETGKNAAGSAKYVRLSNRELPAAETGDVT